MAAPELPNSSLTDCHCFTTNETRLLCTAPRHMDAMWRIGGCECLQVCFPAVAEEQHYPSSLREGAASLSVESVGVTTQGTVAINAAHLPFSFTCAHCWFLSPQCWDCCGVLREWGDQWWHPPADVLAAPRQPHRGRRPGPGEHPTNGAHGAEQPHSAPLPLNPVSLPAFSLYLGLEMC